MINFISSQTNPKIKNLFKLIDKPRERRKQGVAVVEGEKEIQSAIASGLKAVEVFYCQDFFAKDPVEIFKDKKIISSVSADIFTKASYRENPDGIMAIFLVKNKNLEDIKISKNPLILILEGTEKPGNLGAIARTADAARVDFVITNDLSLDVYNPNAIRASRGAIFNLPIVSADRKEIIKWLFDNKIKSFSASDKAEKIYTECDFSGPIAIILGAEHQGLSEEWKEKANELIRIPMAGISDSLNLSVSAAVILFEIVRQRGLDRNK